MSEQIFSKCGMRCDLCLAYRPNVALEDRRAELCAAWSKMRDGYTPTPIETICDGCCSESSTAVLFSSYCRARDCVIQRNLPHCGHCEAYPCAIFPAEPTAEELHQKIDIEKRWSWEEEALTEAYNCRKNMDEFRKKKT